MWPGIFAFMRLRGARLRLPGEVWDACAACDFAREARRNSLFLPPCGRGVRPPAKFGTPAWRAISPVRRGGILCSCRPAGAGFRRIAKFGTPARRAARWGRLWGCAPFAAPLASPPKHPQRRFSASIRWRGHASYAAGASLSRSARSGDLPPRRVNAIASFRFE